MCNCFNGLIRYLPSLPVFPDDFDGHGFSESFERTESPAFGLKLSYNSI